MVTYTAPRGGASATFPGGSKTAAIDASGQASIAVAANGVVGSYTVMPPRPRELPPQSLT